MKYTFADLNFLIDEKYDFLKKEAKDYIGSFNCADFSFSVTEENLEYEQSQSEFKYSKPYLEFIAVLRKIGEFLPNKDAFVLHSACIDVEGTGIAFAAKSGTGKTTHLSRWKSYLGDKMTVVNGDKPIVRFFKDKKFPIAYGTPWCGKERLGCNSKTPLKHICFIERSDKNFVESIDKKDAADRIFNQVYMPRSNPMTAFKTLGLIEDLLSSVKLWIIHCNMDQDAGEIAYKHIFK